MKRAAADVKRKGLEMGRVIQVSPTAASAAQKFFLTSLLITMLHPLLSTHNKRVNSSETVMIFLDWTDFLYLRLHCLPSLTRDMSCVFALKEDTNLSTNYDNFEGKSASHWDLFPLIVIPGTPLMIPGPLIALLSSLNKKRVTLQVNTFCSNMLQHLEKLPHRHLKMGLPGAMGGSNYSHVWDAVREVHMPGCL